MIHLYKKLADIPQSLRTDAISLSKNPAKTTHDYRCQVIADGKYPDPAVSVSYDARYKMRDIKEALDSIYHKKCAYCEVYDPMPQIEHFRPKRGGYYWLAFSWDNLLISCSQCNIHKSNYFAIQNAQVSFTNSANDIELINTLSSSYDAIEKPLLLNPETVSQMVLDEIKFDKNGFMLSLNNQVNYTIMRCNLNRKDLCEKRKAVWDELLMQLADCVLGSKGDIAAEQHALFVVINSFKRMANDVKNEFIAFRKFVLRSGWIENEIRTLHTLSKK